MTSERGKLAWFWALRVLLLVTGTAPLWVRPVASLPGLGTFASALEDWFAFQCRQDETRALVVAHLHLPVCARCAGLYWGLALGAVLYRPKLSPRATRNWVLSASALMLADVASEALGLRSSMPGVRTLTGLILAYPVAIAMLQSVGVSAGAKDPERRR